MFKVTIRELLLLTLVVGMGLGWGLDRSREFKRVKRQLEFWRNTAISFQAFMELDGNKVQVHQPRCISVTRKDGITIWQTGSTGRESAGFKATEAWPSSDELGGRDWNAN